jgi:quercetin dioxygenase-like cupin family protein
MNDELPRVVSQGELKYVPKGWGYELWIVNNEKYCGKRLYFAAGKKLSWHYHKIKDETFYVTYGRLVLFYGWEDDIALAQTTILNPGDTFHVPVGLRHRLLAYEESEILEFSTHHEDSDSYRIEKGD